jgi:DNA-directed RNA polymerase subunit RPC12/RpoP
MMFAMRRPPVVEKECQHNYESEITYPTCTSKGYTTYICSECGDTYTADETEIKKHDFTAVETKSTCKVEGFTTYTCNVCGYSYTGNETSISDHIDENADSKCDFNCGYEYEKADDLTPDVSEEIMSDNCSCNCHKGGISGFFFKLILFFQKIFKTNKTCSCGVAHY